MDPYTPPALARSTLLALWLALGPRDTASRTRAARLVQGDDEPHEVAGLDPEDERAARDADGPPNGVGTLLAAWSGADAVVALLPEAGRAAAVPAAVSHAAVETGECVLVELRGRAFAAVPEVRRFGSDFEPGHLVRWDVVEVDPWQTRVLGAVGTVEDAERELRAALVTATEALDSLDVASWREDAADTIARLRGPVDLGASVPAALDPRRVRALSQAVRLRTIVQLATVDDGGAVNVWQSDQRGAALHQVGEAARRALEAATFHLR
ncbi:hypothetical protein GCM10025864_40280 [Luteimicrobium album]|uniref:Uncharacterized protein n=1 Tax=Luteimicrobium album TaxID=1054550 RepID=A0ABQ6I980_9MICO|nr:hypothetical protein [Luteimicrobium album]GMA26269.1 hypothetical protein GCM10025864_40280 [Luteimicrobium album]